jgi:hypothetical protein
VPDAVPARRGLPEAERRPRAHVARELRARVGERGSSQSEGTTQVLPLGSTFFLPDRIGSRPNRLLSVQLSFARGNGGFYFRLGFRCCGC